MVTTVLVEKRPHKDAFAILRKQVQTQRPATLHQATQKAASEFELSDSERYQQIRVRAYFKAEQRGFAPGHMWDDWLAAEREVSAKAAVRHCPADLKT
jgi:Protein of unknown function (DUF2934)